MRIDELFDKPLDYRLEVVDEDAIEGTFYSPSGTPYIVNMFHGDVYDKEKNELTTYLEAEFEVDRLNPYTQAKRKRSEEFAIFSTVVYIINKGIEITKADVLAFSADASEPSRVKLYNRLAKWFSDNVETKTSEGFVHYKVLL